MLKRLAICFLLVLGFSTFARADVATGWTRIETENFEFVGNADEASIRMVAERLGRFRTALGKVMHIRESAAHTRVIVFKDAVGFRGFKPLKADGTPDEKVLGLFVAGEDFNTIALAADNPDLGTVYHEYIHNIVSASFGTDQIPPWLNEGLASYFQTFQIPDEKTAKFGSARPEYLALLRTTPLIPWDEFFALDNFTLHQDAVNVRPIFYAQAWALASYLLSRSSNEIVEPNLMVAEINKIERSRLSDAITFAGGEAAVRQLDIVGGTHGSRMTSSPVSEALANAILGDLLYRQRNSQTESYLKRAIELDPKLAVPYTTLGQLRMRERKFAEAKAVLEKAIALDSQSHLAHFAYAFLLLRENLDEAAMLRPLRPDIMAKIRGAVTRSIALNAKFGESHYLLATIEFSSGDIVIAETAIRKAVDLKPGNQNYALLLAQILLRQEKTDEPTRIASRLAAKPEDSRIKAEALAVLKNAGKLLKAINTANDAPEIHLAGYRKPIIVRYSDLTAEQVARIDRDREIFNYNVLIDRPTTGESHAVGYIDRIDCIDERIEFRVRSGKTRLSLSAKKFDDVRFRVTVPGTRSFAFRCGTRLPDDLAVIVFKPGRSPVTGELKAITFVPRDFEFRTAEELMSSTHYVVEGRPPQDISQNEATSAREREAMEREMRETHIRDIEERLRQPGDGDERLIGLPEKLECKGGRMSITFKVGDSLRSFSTAITKPFELQSFNPEAQLVEVGCRAQLPPVPAVISFKKADNELVSVEFVPAWFKLR
jgi:tetratricopeptide (TPR) repeat protein